MTCTACNGNCPTPTACQVPEPTPAPRRFRPTFDIEGPHFPRTRAGWAHVVYVAIAITGAFFIAGALSRHYFGA